jgi:hypothetical protein
MTDDLVRRNVDLAFELVFDALARESVRSAIADASPRGTFVLVDPNDDELSAANEQLARELEARAEPALLLEVQKKLTLQAH